MPLHEYECDACGHRFEAIRKFSDPPLKTCPKCGGAVRKLISSPAFQFKGTGWYITDYPKKKEQTGKAGDSTDGPGADKTTTSEKSEAPAKDKSETPAKSDTAPTTTSSATVPSKDSKNSKDSKDSGR